MSFNILGTPEGTRDRLFSECRDRRAAQSAITSLFKRRGSSEVVTPEVEYYDLFRELGDPIAQESMLKIIDRTGRILVMRPDCTAPIARVAATKLKNAVFPQRLYYNQTIFRSDDINAGTDSEIAQCGIELIGASGVKGDAEAIAMAIDTLEACKAESFHIEIGHAGFFRALAAGLTDNTELQEMIRKSIESKNYTHFESLLEPFGDKAEAAALRRLAYLFGGPEVLEQAESLADSAEEKEPIEYLKKLYGELCSAGRGDRVRFDLGLVNRVDYYTGVMFRAYVEGAGKVVLAGGRYDNLISAFGKDLPSTGFSVYVDELASCLPPAPLPTLETVIHYKAGLLGEALELLDSLPYGSCELSPYENEDESEALAKAKKAKRIVFLSGNEKREKKL